jgi:outer membrane protein assembly factor BamB
MHSLGAKADSLNELVYKNGASMKAKSYKCGVRTPRGSAKRYLSLVAPAIAVVLMTQLSRATADDWPQWGGLRRDLVWREKGIVDKLPTDGLLPRVWSTPLAEGYAGPAVADGRVFVMDFVRKNDPSGSERVLCLDAETGKVLWKHEYPVRYSIGYANGPRATPTVDGDRVYTVGAVGDMFCLDVGTGKVLWKKAFREDFGTRVPRWGMAAAPLVDGDQVIVLVGGEAGIVASMDRRTGKVQWRSVRDQQPGYCPPVIFTFGDTRQLVIWHPEAVSSLDPGSGKVIWQVPFPIRQYISIATPRKAGNRLFVSSFYSGPLMIDVASDGKSARIAWQGKGDSEINSDGVHCLMSTPFVNDTHIYGVCTYGQLRCLDATKGERIWETLDATGSGRWWNAFLVPHEDRFFIHNEQGDLIIANLSPRGYEEISRAKLVEPTRRVQRRMTIWSHPAFAMKSVFARNDKEIVRVNLAAGSK